MSLPLVNLDDGFNDEVKGEVDDFLVISTPDFVADTRRDFVCKLVLFTDTGFADFDSVSIFGRVVVGAEIFPIVIFSFDFVLTAYLSDSFGVVPTSLMDGVLMVLVLVLLLVKPSTPVTCPISSWVFTVLVTITVFVDKRLLFVSNFLE